MKKIDARGLSCPQPVIMARKAIQDMDAGEVVITVDTMAQVQNVSRSVKKLGWDARYNEKEGEYSVILKK